MVPLLLVLNTMSAALGATFLAAGYPASSLGSSEDSAAAVESISVPLILPVTPGRMMMVSGSMGTTDPSELTVRTPMSPVPVTVVPVSRFSSRMVALLSIFSVVPVALSSTVTLFATPCAKARLESGVRLMTSLILPASCS